MKKVQRILPSALEDDLLKLGRARVVMKRWEEVVGSSLANRSFPDRFDHGVLWVAVEGSAWAQELRLMKLKILQRLNELSGHSKLFADIRFGVRKLPPLEPDPASEPPAPAASEFSISEIARRRLSMWHDVNKP